MSKNDPTLDENWERDTLRRLAFATLNEQRRARRWRLFFIFLFFVYLFVTLILVVKPDLFFKSESSDTKHTALIDIDGVIASNTAANADNIVTSLRSAFKDKNTSAIILRINSPGGSPVQAGYINDELLRLRKKYKDIAVYAVITDICASGGYYIAAGADKIYADKASLVGSIGVLMDGFGFVDTLKKLGIERRLMTAGDHKGFLDPFSPANPEDQAHIKTLLTDIHDQFINVVKKGRKKSLTVEDYQKFLDNKALFSGLIWTGEQALALGLVDGLGSSSYVAREIIKVKKLRDFTLKPDYLERLAQRFGQTMANILSQEIKGTISLQ
ncbi:MAG: signal peptide peptidase SppA [Thiomargarita sp.]|nr:signal peptide peptidase SppA [Thiomargarita sp.]